ncbi:MAG TPA: gluconeogenesis factor YvcK family protein, partial [Limnochordia bacterium]
GGRRARGEGSSGAVQVVKWLYPGMRVKRWLCLVGVGVLCISVGIALFAGVAVLGALETSLIGLSHRLLGVSPLPLTAPTGLALVALGIACISWGIRQTIRSLMAVFAPEDVPYLADIVFERRHLARGPRVVAIGGGTGLSTLLRGLKAYTSRITAIVTVADDGGSSGRIRSELGILPPGDIRNTLVALADTEPLMERLFQYRFGRGEGLEGHSFGNLFIAAMCDVTGDFEEAVRQSSRVLAVRGRVLPSTLTDVALRAEYADGTVEVGESRIPRPGKTIRRVSLVPEAPEPHPEVLRAIARADLIVLGPGSLYTSVIPNLLVRGLADALRRSPAVKVYVCNVMTQPGETDGYGAVEHVQAILDHVGPGLLDHVVMNSEPVPPAAQRRYNLEGAHPVRPDEAGIRRLGLTPVCRPLISKNDLVRHDPERLAETVMEAIGPSGLSEGRFSWDRARPWWRRGARVPKRAPAVKRPDVPPEAIRSARG